MTQIVARIDEASQISEARRKARELAMDINFDEHAAEKAALVVTEACTNMLKYAGGGQVVVGYANRYRAVSNNDAGVVEVLALDKGSGIGNVKQSVADGYSTSGTAGTGLGAIARLSSFWEIYSRENRGTALLARITATDRTTLESADLGAVRWPKPGQLVCGDDWGVMGSNGLRTFLLADGLGHGPDAAEASRAAVDTLQRHSNLRPGEILESVHNALRHTRGAAVAVAELDSERNVVTFAGLGNISAIVFADGESPRQMVSNNGTAGMQVRHLREFTYPWHSNAALVLHSDGIGTHWSLGDYPGLSAHDPALIAGVIYRDFARGTDDATIVVAK